jgi:hypothetical protein
VALVSAWTHACCELCFLRRHPGQTPHRVPTGHRTLETCCYCFKATTGGIYDRENPADARCKGTLTKTHQE